MTKENAIAEIRSNLDCRKYLTRSRSGMYNCPFCGSGTGHNQTGALQVNRDNSFHCHACGKHGDVIDLIRQTTGADFNQALEHAAQQLGISIEQEKAVKEKTADLRQENLTNDKLYLYGTKTPSKRLTEPCKPIAEANHEMYYKECRERLTDNRAISYLQARGISTETAARLGIGFDPQADPAESGHPTPRIIIPTTAAHYIGRSIDPETPKQYAKMNNKGGKPGILNCKALYQDASKAVFVTEGAFDALALEEVGAAAVALNSTANCSLLLKQLAERPTEKPLIISLDNDEAGNRAATKLHEDLTARGICNIVYNVAGDSKDPNEALTKDRSAFTKAVKDAAQEAAETTPPDVLTDFFNRIQGNYFKPYTTGLHFLDDVLNGGVIKQTLTILLAAPGTGKTTLMQRAAEELAEQGTPVIYLNLEMSQEQMLAKAISGRLAKRGIHLTANRIMQGYSWTDEDRENITQELSLYRQSSFKNIAYKGNIGSDLNTILEYLNEAGKAAQETGQTVPVVFLDYLHLVTSDKRIEAQELIKQTVTGLKRYAIDYNTFVFAISAVNRETMKENETKLYSGRDSSNIEYTADNVLTLEREQEQTASDWQTLTIKAVKARYGKANESRTISFCPAYNYFAPVAGFIGTGSINK